MRWRQRARSRRLTAVVVSTDSEEIARCAAACGADPQGLRPAQPRARRQPGRRRAEGCACEVRARASAGRRGRAAAADLAVSHRRATSTRPSRPSNRRRADTVTSVRLASEHPYWAWKKVGAEIRPYHSMRKASSGPLAAAGGLRRERRGLRHRAPLVMRGAVYGRRVVPYVMDAHSSLDVDTAEDLRVGASSAPAGGAGNGRPMIFRRPALQAQGRRRR